MPNLVRALGTALVAAALLAACQSLPGLAPAAGPLLSVTVRGGECPDGPCGATTVIERDGRVHQTKPGPVEIGTLTAPALTALDAAVKTTDFDVIRSRPFTGECPVNFDGQEFIYEFGAPRGVERIASCETEIDENHPLFVAASAALSEAPD